MKTSAVKERPVPGPSTKFADLAASVPAFLGVVSRMGIKPGFGDSTVAEVCAKEGIDTSAFLLICNVYTYGNYTPSRQLLDRADPGEIVRYLRNSHTFFLEYYMEQLSEALRDLLSPCPEKQKSVFLKFLHDYKEELARHFSFEEESVFPFVKAVLDGDNPHETVEEGITEVEDSHISVREKIEDLKNIILKYLPAQCDSMKAYSILQQILAMAYDLDRHTAIEETVLIPMAGRIRKGGIPSEEADETHDELSSREKEILVCVAKGMINKEIADKNNISVHTVITHRKNITRKTGIKTVAGLTVYALLGGLLDISDFNEQVR